MKMDDLVPRALGFCPTCRVSRVDVRMVSSGGPLRSCHRPYQTLYQMPPLCEQGRAIDITAPIERKRIVGGLISEYRRAAQ
jgi:hypothetical protein